MEELAARLLGVFHRVDDPFDEIAVCKDKLLDGLAQEQLGVASRLVALNEGKV